MLGIAHNCQVLAGFHKWLHQKMSRLNIPCLCRENREIGLRIAGHEVGLHLLALSVVSNREAATATDDMEIGQYAIARDEETRTCPGDTHAFHGCRFGRRKRTQY